MAGSSKKIAEGRTKPWLKTIFGEPASKANSRKLAKVNGRTLFIKSDKARSYLGDFLRQCPYLDPLFTCDVVVEADIYYASRRPDVDPSVILDAMQGRIYVNDRQVRRIIATGHVDKENPRVDLHVYPYVE